MVKNQLARTGDLRDWDSIPGSGRTPGEGTGNTLVFLPRDSHGQNCLADYSPQGGKERDTTKVTELARMHKVNTALGLFLLNFGA